MTESHFILIYTQTNGAQIAFGPFPSAVAAYDYASSFSALREPYTIVEVLPVLSDD